MSSLRLAVFPCALALLSPSLFGRVRLEVEMVALPPAVAVSVVPTLRDSAASAQAWEKLQEMREKGAATLLATSLIWLKNGDLLTSETTSEWKYPATFPTHINKQVLTAEEAAREKVLDQLPQWGPEEVTAIETREQGAVIEARVTESPDSPLLALNLGVTLTRLRERKTWPRPPAPNGMSGSTERPLFARLRFIGSFAMRSGEQRLVGTFTVPGPAPAVVLLVVRATRFPDHL